MGTRKWIWVIAALCGPGQVHAQRRVAEVAHQITEHFFAVSLVAAAHTSTEGLESLQDYIETGNMNSWKKYLGAFVDEFGSTRLHTEIAGYHLVDMPVEFLAKMGGKLSPGFAGFSRSFIGKQVLGIIGFFGYDYVADLNRCVEEKIVADRAHNPLVAKMALEKFSRAWNLVTDYSAASEYIEKVKECLGSDRPFGRMAWDRFLDAENILFMGAIGTSIEFGDRLKPYVKRGCARFLMSNPRRAVRVGRRVSKVVGASAAVLSIGAVYQLLSTKPFRAAADAVNSSFRQFREGRNQDNLQDLLLRYVTQPNDPDLLAEILETRGALLANLLAEVNLAAKPLWDVARDFAEIDPAVRHALAEDSEHMEDRIAQSGEQLKQVRELLETAKRGPASPTLSDIKSEGLTSVEILGQVQSQLEELYFPNWWTKTPHEVAEIMRKVFAHFQAKALAVSTEPVDRLRARAMRVMEDLGQKFAAYGAPQNVLEEHEKVKCGLSRLLAFGGPMDTQMLRKLELIERYSHMPRPDTFLARGEDLNWTDPKWFRVLGQDPRLGLRGY